jgi:transmembrane protein DUF3556
LSRCVTHLPDIDARTVREREFVCNSLIGFNFGDGHLHNAEMVQAVQREADFEPGGCVVAWVESEAFGSASSTISCSTGPSPSTSAGHLSGSQPGHGALA